MISILKKCRPIPRDALKFNYVAQALANLRLVSRGLRLRLHHHTHVDTENKHSTWLNLGMHTHLEGPRAIPKHIKPPSTFISLHHSERVHCIPVISAIRSINLVDAERRIINSGDGTLLLNNQTRMVFIKGRWTPLASLAGNFECAVINPITGVYLDSMDVLLMMDTHV